MIPEKISIEIYNVPNHAVTWFLYGDRDSVSDEEIEVYKEFLKEAKLWAVETVSETFDECGLCDVTGKYLPVVGMAFQVLE